MRIEDIVQLLHRVRRNGSGWLACCPAHEDHNPSLSISEGEGGRILLRCFAGGSIEAILGALGLTKRDLFQQGGERPASSSQTSADLRGKNGRGKRHTTQEVAAEAAAFGLKRKYHKDYKRVAFWKCQDSGGKEVGRVYRFEDPAEGHSSKQYWPVCRDGSGWRIGDPPGGFPLYRLPQLRAMTGPVFVTEGEKAADVLVGAGPTVTTSAHGAQTVPSQTPVAS